MAAVTLATGLFIGVAQAQSAGISAVCYDGQAFRFGGVLAHGEIPVVTVHANYISTPTLPGSRVLVGTVTLEDKRLAGRPGKLTFTHQTIAERLLKIGANEFSHYKIYVEAPGRPGNVAQVDLSPGENRVSVALPGEGQYRMMRELDCEITRI